MLAYSDIIAYNYNMMGNYNNGYDWSNAFGLGFGAGLFLAPLFVLVIIWTLYWKYKALWHAAKHDHKKWFIALLIINTVGVLEILYLHVFSKKKN